MTLASAIHLVLHTLVPGAVAWFFFRAQWRKAWVIMLATMLVDLDHLLADPIYDPNRCGIGFHPLHTAPAIAVYAVLAILPATRLVGVGLVLHIALDLADCGVQRALRFSLSFPFPLTAAI
ncbi:MAG TPA: DUF6122 family protein [Burkholderiales bacterium]|nr:DUF6122 family protein [Burkholderiales bacterium]